MRNISYALTTQQVRDGTKFETRRNGWKDVKVGEHLMGCVKCQGLGKGGKIERIREVVVTYVRFEPLLAITKAGCILEGFPDMEPAEFVAMYCGHNGNLPSDEVTVIGFDYVEKPCPTCGRDYPGQGSAYFGGACPRGESCCVADRRLTV